MKVLVAGADGLIGSRLVEKLRARGDEAVALVRKRRAGSAGVRTWDELPAPLEGADAAVNLAGASIAGRRWSEAWKREIRDSRVGTTRALVEAMRALSPRPRAFIGGSAIGIYGSRGDELLDESTTPGDNFLTGICRD